MAKFLKLDHYYKTVKIEEAIATIPEVIKILESFDPAIPNDVTACMGLKCAKDMGIKSMMTGPEQRAFLLLPYLPGGGWGNSRS